MKPEELYDLVKNYCIHDWIVWIALEEARTYGFNIIYFTIATNPPICNGYLAIAYDITKEDVQVLAMLIVIGSTENLDIDMITKIARSVNGIIVTLGPYTGILIPIETDDKIRYIDRLVMHMCRELSNKECYIVIDGYYFDIFI